MKRTQTYSSLACQCFVVVVAVDAHNLILFNSENGTNFKRVRLFAFPIAFSFILLLLLFVLFCLLNRKVVCKIKISLVLVWLRIFMIEKKGTESAEYSKNDDMRIKHQLQKIVFFLKHIIAGPLIYEESM